MGTKNKHVACYLPPDIEKFVTDYAFANDYTRYEGKEPKLGSAIIAMLREYCTQSNTENNTESITPSYTKYNTESVTESDTSNAVTLKALTERIETLEAEIRTDQDRLTAILREADIINQQKLDERLGMATSPLWDDLNLLEEKLHERQEKVTGIESHIEGISCPIEDNAAPLWGELHRLEEKINSIPLPSTQEDSQLEERIGITIAQLWDAIEYLGETLEGSDRAEEPPEEPPETLEETEEYKSLATRIIELLENHPSGLIMPAIRDHLGIALDRDDSLRATLNQLKNKKRIRSIQTQSSYKQYYLPRDSEPKQTGEDSAITGSTTSENYGIPTEQTPSELPLESTKSIRQDDLPLSYPEAPEEGGTEGKPSDWMIPKDFADYVSGILGEEIKVKALTDKVAKTKPEAKKETENGFIFDFRGLTVERKKVSARQNHYRLIGKV